MPFALLFGLREVLSLLHVNILGMLPRQSVHIIYFPEEAFESESAVLQLCLDNSTKWAIPGNLTVGSPYSREMPHCLMKPFLMPQVRMNSSFLWACVRNLFQSVTALTSNVVIYILSEQSA